MDGMPGMCHTLKNVYSMYKIGNSMPIVDGVMRPVTHTADVSVPEPLLSGRETSNFLG